MYKEKSQIVPITNLNNYDYFKKLNRDQSKQHNWEKIFKNSMSDGELVTANTFRLFMFTFLYT